MYFDENLVLDLRLNYLDKFVDKFIIVECSYNHKGEKRKPQFNLEKFSKFKNKIKYILINENSPDLKKIDTNDTNADGKYIVNAVKRENFQRNSIIKGLDDASDNDWILISDLDEIPNLENTNLKSLKEKIIIFKQKIFYYKFNLLYKKLDWYGTKCCKYKYLKNISQLRHAKPKKYDFYRIDTLFSDSKFIDLKIIQDGGWHFTNLKTPEDLMKKYLNDEMHSEFIKHKTNLDEIKRLVKERKINYDHFAKTNTPNKYINEFQLNKVDLDFLPSFLKENYSTYKEWFD